MQKDESVEEVFQEANLHYKRGEYGQAEGLFRQIIEQCPGTTEAYRSTELIAEIKGDGSVLSGASRVEVGGGDGRADFEPRQSVIVSDVCMPFGSMVVFMVKWSLASIPAIAILFLIIAVISALFGGLFAGLLR